MATSIPNNAQVTLPRQKKLLGFLTIKGLGCGRYSSPAAAVTVPENTRRKRRRKKKKQSRRNTGFCTEDACCTCAPPSIGFAYDVAHSTSADLHRRNHRQIVMREHDPLLNGAFEGSDRFGAWRINADLMSYEELVELSDRIGYVDGGLQEDEISECLKRPKKSFIKSFDFNSQVKGSKCSICQEECKGDEDLGKLECGHYHHLDCIKQWLLRKNECPICKTVAKPNK
ncbi:E3 ubiquitin protein ligase MBR2-like protein [Tanacetum coccineum]